MRKRAPRKSTGWLAVFVATTLFPLALFPHCAWCLVTECFGAVLLLLLLPLPPLSTGGGHIPPQVVCIVLSLSLSLFLFSFCLYARVCVSVRLYTVHCGKQELDEMECGRGEMVLPPVHWLLLLLLCTSLHFFSLQVLHCIIFASSALRERERESLCPQGQGSSLRESGEKGASCLQLLIFGGDASRLGECVQRC